MRQPQIYKYIGILTQKKSAAFERGVDFKLITGVFFLGTGVPVYFFELTGVLSFLTLDGVLCITRPFFTCGVACRKILCDETLVTPSGVDIVTFDFGVFWDELSGVFSIPCSGFLFGL